MQLQTCFSVVLKNRFPEGKRETRYKRTLVEEYAPYAMADGLVIKIHRHEDLECGDSPVLIEEYFENRHDLMTKIVRECSTGKVVEYFERGRDDAVKSKNLRSKIFELIQWFFRQHFQFFK